MEILTPIIFFVASLYVCYAKDCLSESDKKNITEHLDTDLIEAGKTKFINCCDEKKSKNRTNYMETCLINALMEMDLHRCVDNPIGKYFCLDDKMNTNECINKLMNDIEKIVAENQSGEIIDKAKERFETACKECEDNDLSFMCGFIELM